MQVNRRIAPGELTLKQAALTAGFAYLLNPVTFGEAIFPKLVHVGETARTVADLRAHPQLFAAVIMSYLFSCAGDLVLGWSLFYLVAPVHRALSLLAAWLRLAYATVAMSAMLELVNVHRMLRHGDFERAFGTGQFEAQVQMLMGTFHAEWGLSLVLFGMHLLVLGALIYRAGYLPRWLGLVLMVNGAGWAIDSVQPYAWPEANLSWLMVTFFGEVVFMLWLLIRGWRLGEPLSPGAEPTPAG